MENITTKYDIPEYIIMDQDSTFMSSLTNYFFKKLDNHFRLNMELNFYQIF